MKKSLLLTAGGISVAIGLLSGFGWYTTGNMLLGLLTFLVIAGGFMLYKGIRTREYRSKPIKGGKQKDDGKEPNTLTWYGIFDATNKRYRGALLQPEYVENPQGRPKAWENLGGEQFYHRVGILDNNGNPQPYAYKPVTLPDRKYLSPKSLLIPLTLPNYTKYIKYLKQETDVIPLAVLGVLIAAEIIGLVIIP